MEGGRGREPGPMDGYVKSVVRNPPDGRKKPAVGHCRVDRPRLSWAGLAARRHGQSQPGRRSQASWSGPPRWNKSDKLSIRNTEAPPKDPPSQGASKSESGTCQRQRYQRILRSLHVKVTQLPGFWRLTGMVLLCDPGAQCMAPPVPTDRRRVTKSSATVAMPVRRRPVVISGQSEQVAPSPCSTEPEKQGNCRISDWNKTRRPGRAKDDAWVLAVDELLTKLIARLNARRPKLTVRKTLKVGPNSGS